ncbi:wnt inhibitor of Dorsal protein [Drosophila sulfurigaster albostrigata]|uniref:wnt inhibitor of Dorsal protein n=1 Tax=Drosophila sulfurigaster albostrigata TaxID=89887 RepID=UPI002D21DB3C|nr:wnt inhibitor of Dorsal protein [Drosophila sulfurigaster albostrigata]
MFYTIHILLSLASMTMSAHVADPGSYYRYSTQFQAPLSWDSLIASSLERAIESCQQSFKWQRWNCPSVDFIKRHTAPSEALKLNREDVYVASIAMASIVHTLTTDCANGVIAGCGCKDTPCAHDPAKALQLYEQHFGFGVGAFGHNQRVVGALLEQSMEQECHCKRQDAQGKCLEEQCVQVLKPFDMVAQELQQMYDEAIQLDGTTSNLKIMWQNIPLDSLVYMEDSPNYCEPEASGRWPGTRGRQCSKTGGNSMEERLSCQQLCRVCGFRVRSQHVRHERRCNCKLVWGFRLQCDVCVQLERQYSCY